MVVAVDATRGYMSYSVSKEVVAYFKHSRSRSVIIRQKRGVDALRCIILRTFRESRPNCCAKPTNLTCSDTYMIVLNQTTCDFSMHARLAFLATTIL